MSDQQHQNNSTNKSAAPKRSPLRSILIALVIVIPIIAAIARFTVWPRTVTYYTDADQIKTPSDQAKLREILWQPPQVLPDLIDAGFDAYEPRFSVDGLTLYFVRGKAGDNADIYFSERSYAGWLEPEPVVSINSTYDDLGPEPSQDGQSLYFYSDRPGGQGGYDIWVAHRRGEGSGFSVPINLGPRVNSEFNDYGPAVTPKADLLYFSSNRPLPSDIIQPNPEAWPSTLREDLFHRTYDIYKSSISESGFSPAEPVMSLNTPFNEGSPVVSPVNDFLYFASDRPGGSGGFDLYRTRRIRGNHEPPQNLGTAVNTAANELDPGLTMGGYMLVFSTDQPVNRIDPDKPNPYKLFTTTSREVFRELETQPVSINWAAIWSQVWRNLLWALLALLLIILLLALMGGIQNRKLSLLARCLLASLAAHLLLMLLFNVWNVTSTIAKEFSRRGRIQIALAAPAHGNELTSQIRGEFTSVKAHSATLSSAERAAPSIEIDTLPTMESIEVLTTTRPSFELMSLSDQTSVAEADVKPTFQIARLTPHKPDTLLPTKLHIDLPNEMHRTSAVETTQFNLPKLASSTSQSRADVAPSLLLLAEAPTIANLAPSDNARSSVVDASTMNPDQLPSRGAILASAVLPLSLADFATVTPPPSLDLELPPNNTSRAFTTESTANFDDSSTMKQATPRANVSDNSSLIIVSSPAARFELDTSNETFSSPSTPSKPSFKISDTSPSTTAVDNILSPTIDTPTLPLANLALPNMELPTEQAVSEVTLAYAITPRSTIRAPFEDQLKELSDSLNTFAELQPTIDTKTEDAALPQQIQDASTPVATSILAPTIDLPQTFFSNTKDDLSLTLEIPIELEPQENPLAQRDERVRKMLLEGQGGGDKAKDAVTIGVIRGLVTDQTTGEPVDGAMILLNLPDRPDLSVMTNHSGKYRLSVPSVPDHFALSASKSGFTPSSVDVSATELMNNTIDVDFFLERSAPNIVAIEAVPEVHHLGDNRFEGRINSQFQKEAEGAVFAVTFTLDSDQLEAATSVADIQLLAKGVQVGHRLAINGQMLTERLDHSPRDGSFGEFTTRFDTDMLHPGTNTFHILAGSRGNDVDDFEFVNVQIRLPK